MKRGLSACFNYLFFTSVYLLNGMTLHTEASHINAHTYAKNRALSLRK